MIVRLSGKLLGILLVFGAAGCVGCSSLPTWSNILPPGNPQSGQWVHRSGTLWVDLPDQQRAQIGYEITENPEHAEPMPWIVLVPGGGATSWRGEQTGDGVHRYPLTVEVYRQWATALAAEGFSVFAFDKRNCHLGQPSRCRANPMADMDQEGPSALARDVDAACAVVRKQPNANAGLILMTQGPGLIPVLHSRCAKAARGLVMLSPIPRRIDRVWVHALEHRWENERKRAARIEDAVEREKRESSAAALHNRAGSLREMFASMERGEFAQDARIMGVTLAYWQAWMKQTGQTQERLASLQVPKLVLVGMNDVQYGPEDRARIRRWSQRADTAVQEIPAADHHLLSREKLSAQARMATVRWLQEMRRQPIQPPLVGPPPS